MEAFNLWQSVNFKSKTNLLAANLYTPEQFDEKINIHQYSLSLRWRC